MRGLCPRGFRYGVVTLLTIAAASAQVLRPPMSTRHYDFDISSLNGLTVHGEARGVAGIDYEPAVSITVAGGRATMHRLFLDRTHHLFLGYDLTAVPEPGTARVHLHFSRLTSLESFKGISIEGYAPSDRALFAAEQVVRQGEGMALPLEADRAGSTLLQDQLTFGVPLR